MDWLKRMTDAVEYIEEHMEEPFNAAAIARVAYSSAFHFQRMFHMLTGITVAEYVRRRKLTLAAQELAVKRVKVSDAAFKYGYDTPESFTKAFRRMHGISPSAARGHGAKLKAYPKISFQLSLKGDKDMDYKLTDRDSFRVIGKGIRVTTRNGENFKKVPEFWNECMRNGFCNRLCGIPGIKSILGICVNDFSNEEFTYMIAAEKPQGFKDEDMTELEIPASTWAVFEAVGPLPGSIQEIWKRIFSEWFPATNYEHADAPELEVYPPENSGQDDYRCEVWIPVVKKQDAK